LLSVNLSLNLELFEFFNLFVIDVELLLWILDFLID
jgi:hypothetical protein